jgi:hypothetical protein
MRELTWHRVIASGTYFPRESFKRTQKEADVFYQQLMLESYHYSLPNHML